VVEHSLDHQVGPYKLGLQFSRLSAALTVVDHLYLFHHLIEGALLRVLRLHLPLLLTKHFVCGLHTLYQFTHVPVCRTIKVRNVIGKVVRDAGLSTKYQELGRSTSTVVWGAPVSSHNLRGAPLPIPFVYDQVAGSGGHPLACGCYALPPISFGIVWGCPALIYSLKAAEVAHQLRLEVSAPGGQSRTIHSCPTHGPQSELTPLA